LDIDKNWYLSTQQGIKIKPVFSDKDVHATFFFFFLEGDPIATEQSEDDVERKTAARNS